MKSQPHCLSKFNCYWVLRRSFGVVDAASVVSSFRDLLTVPGAVATGRLSESAFRWARARYRSRYCKSAFRWAPGRYRSRYCTTACTNGAWFDLVRFSSAVYGELLVRRGLPGKALEENQLVWRREPR